MNFKLKKSKNKKAKRIRKIGGWGKGATAKNKIYYGFDKYGDVSSRVE